LTSANTVEREPASAGTAAASLSANALAVTAARLLVPALNLALVVGIARLGGVESLGSYTVLVTLFLILENVKTLGLTSMLVRDVAADAHAALAVYSSLVRISLIGAVLCVPIMVGGATFANGVHPASVLPASIMAFGLFPSAYALVNDALFLALGRARYSTAIALGENLLRLTASLVIVFLFHGGILWLAAIYAFTRMAAAAAGHWVIRNRLHLRPPKACMKMIGETLRQAPAFLTIFVSPIVLFKMDVVLLGIVRGDYEAGIYGAAARLLSVCLILPDGFLTASFATLSRLLGSGALLAFRELIERTIQGLGAGLTGVAALGCVAGRFFLVGLYGHEFSSAVPLLELLLWSLTPFAINRALGDALVAQGRQDLLARIVLAGTAASIVLYLVLIHFFGSIGAAWAFLLSSTLFCCISAIFVCRRLDIARLAPVIRTMGVAIVGLGASLLPDSAVRLGLLLLVMTIGFSDFALVLRPWLGTIRRRRNHTADAAGY